MRKKIIAANWKMNMTQAESVSFVETFLRELGDSQEVEVVLLPPFTALAKVSEALGNSQNVKVGAQNMHWERSGAFTGEISSAMLRDLFVRYVVLGHSGSLAELGPKELGETVIAYEPVWAIGTGKTASTAQAQEAHAFIRRTLGEISDEATAARMRIQYGGSVKPDNARNLMNQPDIDGALVGGASLDPRSFAQIVKGAQAEKA